MTDKITRSSTCLLLLHVDNLAGVNIPPLVWRNTLNKYAKAKIIPGSNLGNSVIVDQLDGSTKRIPFDQICSIDNNTYQTLLQKSISLEPVTEVQPKQSSALLPTITPALIPTSPLPTLIPTSIPTSTPTLTPLPMLKPLQTPLQLIKIRFIDNDGKEIFSLDRRKASRLLNNIAKNNVIRREDLENMNIAFAGDDAKAGQVAIWDIPEILSNLARLDKWVPFPEGKATYLAAHPFNMPVTDPTIKAVLGEEVFNI